LFSITGISSGDAIAPSYSATVIGDLFSITGISSGNTLVPTYDITVEGDLSSITGISAGNTVVPNYSIGAIGELFSIVGESIFVNVPPLTFAIDDSYDITSGSIFYSSPLSILDNDTYYCGVLPSFGLGFSAAFDKEQ